MPAYRDLKPPENATSLPVEMVGNLEPIEVLLFVGLPRLYTVSVSGGLPFLAYLADEQDSCKVILLAPTSVEIVEAIKTGLISVREALARTWLLMVEQTWDDRIVACYRVSPSDIPPMFLPVPGTTLYLEHMPSLTVRATGPKLKAGSLTASAGSLVFDGSRKAIKSLIDCVLAKASSGVSAIQREMYNLCVVGIRIGSLEVDFRESDTLFEMPEVKEAVALLNRGIEWTRNPSGDALKGLSEDEQAAVFEALERLSPPLVGDVTAIEIGGSWVKSGKAKLTRQTRKLVLGQTSGPAHRNVSLYGELFTTNARTSSCTMTVHIRDGQPLAVKEEVTLRLDPDDYDRVAPRASKGCLVNAMGRQQKNVIRIDWIGLVGEEEAPQELRLDDMETTEEADEA